MNPADVKKVIDAVFAELELKFASRPYIVMLLVVLNSMADAMLLQIVSRAQK